MAGVEVSVDDAADGAQPAKKTRKKKNKKTVLAQVLVNAGFGRKPGGGRVCCAVITQIRARFGLVCCGVVCVSFCVCCACVRACVCMRTPRVSWHEHAHGMRGCGHVVSRTYVCAT